MLFDLEPYLPFNAFVVICIFITVGIVGWGSSNGRRK